MSAFLKNYLTKTSYCLATGLLLGTTFIGCANASTQTGNIAVSANVAAVCAITVFPVAFGAYTGTAISLDVSPGVRINCTNGANYTVTLDAGQNGTFTARKLKGGTSGTNTFTYNLYKDSGYTSVWGDGSGSTATTSGTGSGANQDYHIYAKLDVIGAQTLVAGSYSDTVVATVTY